MTAGKLASAASIGLVHLWDTDEGFTALERYLGTTDADVRAGAVLGLGVCHSAVYKPDEDMAAGLLEDYYTAPTGNAEEKKQTKVRMCVCVCVRRLRG